MNPREYPEVCFFRKTFGCSFLFIRNKTLREDRTAAVMKMSLPRPAADGVSRMRDTIFNIRSLNEKIPFIKKEL